MLMHFRRTRCFHWVFWKKIEKLKPWCLIFLVSKLIQVPTGKPSKTNNQGNKMLFLIRNAVEVEKNIRTIKASFQPAGGVHHPGTFMGVLGGIPSIKMVVLGGIFQAGEYIVLVE